MSYSIAIPEDGQMTDSILNSWYLSHLKISWDEAFGIQKQEAIKNKEKDYDPNKWFKERITKTRWFIFVPNFLEPSQENKDLILKEFYRNKK